MTEFNEVTISGSLAIGTGIIPDISLSGNNTAIFNNNRKNLDFYVKGTGTTDSLYYDASTSRVGINTLSPDAALHVVTDCTLDGLKLENNSNCGTGVHLLMIHRPGQTPIDGSFPGTISLAGRDHNDNLVNYAKLRSRAISTNNNNVTGTLGEFHIYIDQNKTDSLALRLNSSSTLIGTTNDISPGSASYNLIGSGNSINGSSFLVLGNNNSADPAFQNIIVGLDNNSDANFNQIIGRSIELNSSGNTAIGYTIYHDGRRSYIYGNDIIATGNLDIILGGIHNVSGQSCIVAGNRNVSYGNNTIALGSGVSTIGSADTLLGQNLSIVGNSGIVIGLNNAVTGNSNFIIGNDIRVISSGLFICGESVNVSNTIDSLILEKNIAINNVSGIVIVGRGNNISSTSNILGVYGYKNTTQNSTRNTNILGDQNAVSNTSGVMVVGTLNTVSGTVNNTIAIGKENYLGNISNNNIFVGNLNNQTGVKFFTNGSTTGTPSVNNSPFVNSIAIGNQNAFPSSGNLIVTIGNKNSIQGNFSTVVGHINSLRNADASILLGKSNYLAGKDNILAGNNNNLYGNTSIVLSPRNSHVFGQDTILIGTNDLVSNGTVIGYDNNLYGDNNNVLGSNNTIGSTRYPFTSAINANSISNFSIAGSTDLVAGDRIFVYVYNPVGSDTSNSIYIYDRTIGSNGVQFSNGVTTITPNNGSVPLTTSPRSNPNNFDDAFDISNVVTASGYIVKISQGSNNYCYGDVNTITQGTGNTVIGYRNTISNGRSNILLGHGLSHEGTGQMIIGPSNSQKIIIGNNIVINSGLGSNNLYIVGTDNSTYTSFDNINHRLGLDTSAPRSTLDVSGTITTTNLRIGLTGINNNVLVTDSDGNIFTANRTMITGSNNGLVYRISDTMGSGLERVVYNPTNNRLTFYNLSSDEVTLVPGCTITPNNGIIFNANNSYDDDQFNVTIYGSGEPGDAPALFDTDYVNNNINLYNTITQTGIFRGDIRVSGLSFLPALQTTGTILTLNRTNNSIEHNRLFPNAVITTTADFKATGYKNIRWFPTQQLFCLSDVSDHTNISDTFLDTDYNTMISNNSNGLYQTIFNRNAYGSHPGSGFVVMYSGVASNRGFRIDYNNGRVGINTTTNELLEKNNRLVVNGSVFANSLRIGEAATSGYALVAVDTSGNIGYRPMDLGLASTTLQYPFIIELTNGINKLKLSSKDAAGVSLQSAGQYNDLGRTLAWNGDSNSWYMPEHFRLYKGSSSSQTNNILFGKNASNYYTTTKNMHAFSAGAFHSSESTYQGSSQYVQYYMRGSGDGAFNTFLTTDWSIDNRTDPDNGGSTIDISSQDQLFHCFSYEVILSVVGRSNINNTTAAGAINIRGAYKKLSGDSSFSPMGSAVVNKFTDSALSSIGAEFVSWGSNKLSVRCTGVANYSTLWSATIKINQLSVPSI